ncbi:hypothetical protein GCM10010245_76420 [Streptomyces spectabilis]|nr:hypothetical protein GCM10010245_76420 [Streptomyces spectabilis]
MGDKRHPEDGKRKRKAPGKGGRAPAERGGSAEGPASRTGRRAHASLVADRAKPIRRRA